MLPSTKTSKLKKLYFLAFFNVLSLRDNSININEFTAICKALFRNDKGKPYK